MVFMIIMEVSGEIFKIGGVRIFVLGFIEKEDFWVCNYLVNRFGLRRFLTGRADVFEFRGEVCSLGFWGYGKEEEV